MSSWPTLRISIAGAFGTSGRTGATSDQCFPHFAPCSTHVLISSICCGVSFRFEAGGGMCTSGSSEVIRMMSTLSSSFPGTRMEYPSRGANGPCFASSVSKRSSAFRRAESGPWQ